jgi:ERCC4-type nuclease
LVIDAPDPFTEKRINEFLLKNGINIEVLTMRSLLSAFSSKNLLQTYVQGQKRNTRQSGHSFTSNENFQKSGSYLKKTPLDLINESNQLDLETAPFRDSSLSDLSVIISSNEPRLLYDKFMLTKLQNVSYAKLDIGDIIITSKSTGDTLLIERKIIQDLNQSVMVGAHSHDQSERMFDAVNTLKYEGKRARAIWMIEAQDDGKHLLDSSLEKIQQISGLFAYFDLINDQSVYQTWSMNHTVYLACKFAQAFFEQKLFYKVKSNPSPFIHRSKKERLAAKAIDPVSVTRDSGVTTHTSNDLYQMLSYIPSINIGVAKELAGTGKSFAEITQMSQKELEAIKGVGKKTAELIFSSFNKRK